MTKEVLVSISGLQFAEETDAEPVEVITSADYYKKNVTYYYTPYGSLLIGIDATKLDVKEAEDSLEVTVDYALEVNYEHLADCTIVMKVQSKGTGDFRI